MIDYKNHKLPKNAKLVFKGVLYDTYQWEQVLFDGSKSTFEKIVRKGSVQLICITKDNKLILYEEEQPHIGSYLSMPGGQIEENDSPLKTAKKELLEETGMTAKSYELYTKTELGKSISWPTYYYICRDCEKIKQPELEAGEKIKPYELEFSEFIKWTQKKEFRNKTFQNMILKILYENKLENFKNLLLE